VLEEFEERMDTEVRRQEKIDRVDIYPKEENTGYAIVNSHNFKSIFIQE